MNRYRELEELRKGWSAPRELLSAPPREVGLTPGGVALAVTGVLLALGSIAGAALLVHVSERQSAEYREILDEGHDIEARVVRLWRKKGENKRTMAEYAFDFEGRTYRKETRVPPALWNTLRVDDPVRVTFLPSNPEVSHLFGRPREPISKWIAAVVGALGFAFAAWIAVALSRSKELLAQGRVAPGVVTRVKESRTQHGAVVRSVEYEFAALGGGIVKGKTASEKKRLDTGSVVCVIYDPDNPARKALYPMQLAKIEREW